MVTHFIFIDTKINALALSPRTFAMIAPCHAFKFNGKFTTQQYNRGENVMARQDYRRDCLARGDEALVTDNCYVNRVSQFLILLSNVFVA